LNGEDLRRFLGWQWGKESLDSGRYSGKYIPIKKRKEV